MDIDIDIYLVRDAYIDIVIDMYIDMDRYIYRVKRTDVGAGERERIAAAAGIYIYMVIDIDIDIVRDTYIDMDRYIESWA